jgi:DNA-binding LacI/PurR family transcriptional regulator
MITLMDQVPTLRAIAKATGVSHETVSRALRNDPKVSIGTRTRIVQIAHKMGYRANPLIQALMRSRSGGRVRKTTANAVFLKPLWETGDCWRSLPFREQLEGTLERLRELGFDASELPVPESELQSPHLDQILRARGVRGIVVGSMPQKCRSLELHWPDLAVVGVGLAMRNPQVDRVTTDIMSGMNRVMEEIKSRGYQRPGLAIRPSQDEKREYWLSAIWSHLQLHGLEKRQRVPLYYGEFDEAKVRRWHQRYKPDAIIAFDLAYLEFLRSMNLKIPDEAGFLQLEAPNNQGRVSGINSQIRKIGALAAELLAEKMLRNDYGIPSQRHTILVQPDWLEGFTLRPRPGKLTAG